MKIRVGFEMIYDFPQPTPLIAVVGTHFTRASDIIVPDHLTTSPSVPITPYRDGFGNWCSRLVAPAGRMRLAADGTVRDSGLPDVIVASAWQHAVEDLPAEAIVYLLGSRYCETDRLSNFAWATFGKIPRGPAPPPMDAVEPAQLGERRACGAMAISSREEVHNRLPPCAVAEDRRPVATATRTRSRR